MLSAKKIRLVPAKEDKASIVKQIGGGEANETSLESGIITSEVSSNKDKIKSRIYDKIHRFIKIILKLAKFVGYDDDLRIKLKNGDYLEKSNIVDLLTHAMSAGRVLYGEQEFIELLADSHVDPNLIINDNVRMKLIQYINKPKDNTNENNTNKSVIEPPKSAKKRKSYDIHDDNTSSKRRKVDYDDIPEDSDSRMHQDDEDRESSRKRIYTEDDITDDDIDKSRWNIPDDE